MTPSKLSEYENRRARPGLQHIEVLCRVYQRSPEALGLITWRDTTPSTPTELPSPNFDAILAAAVADGPADEQLIDLLSEAISLSSAAAVACRELRSALQERASVTLA